jgi:hypothetical protein
MVVQVYGETAGLKQFAFEGCPEKCRTNALEQIRHLGRFREIVIGTRIQSSDFVGFRGTHGKNDDRCFSRDAETPGDVDSVNIRQS